MMAPTTYATRPAIVATWSCRAKGCTFTYADPIGSEKVGHFCPTRDGAWTWARRDAATEEAGR